MGADNWGVCPQCKSKAEASKKKSALDLGKSYGKVSPDEFLKRF